MNMKKQVLIGLLAFAPIFAIAQSELYAPTPTNLDGKPAHWCGATEFAGGDAGLTAWAQQYYNPSNAQRLVNTKKYLPTALHLIANTDGTNQLRPSLALGIMCDVNDDYRSHNIQFWIDSLDFHIKNTTWNDPPTGSTAYYTAMPTSANKFANRTNVYFHGGGGNTGLCGVYHGSAVGNGTAGSPDIVDCFGSCLTRNNTTVSHELGHYLAMPHTFYGLEGSGNLACGTQATSGEKYPRTG